MALDLFALAQDNEGRTDAVRRVVVSVFLVVILLQPAARLFIGPRSGLEWFQLAGSLTLTGIVLWQVTSARDIRRRMEWLGLALALAIALFVVGGPSWLAAPAVAAAMCGRFSDTPFPAIIGAVACSGTGLILVALHDYPSGDIFSVIVIAPLAALFSYSAARRAETTNMLRRTRADLATPGTAVAEISDNGPAWPGDDGARHAQAGSPAPTAGAAAIIRARPALACSGLAGLAERVRALGGELAAGAVDGRGFLLRVVVPLSSQA